MPRICQKEVRVKRCGKSAPRVTVTNAARQAPSGARPNDASSARGISGFGCVEGSRKKQREIAALDECSPRQLRSGSACKARETEPGLQDRLQPLLSQPLLCQPPNLCPPPSTPLALDRHKSYTAIASPKAPDNLVSSMPQTSPPSPPEEDLRYPETRSHRSQRIRAGSQRKPNAGVDHLPKLFPKLHKARRHDRNRHDRSRRVL